MANDLEEITRFKVMDSEEIYRKIVETANEGIWVSDTNLKTVFVSKRMAELLGYTQEEIIGRPVYDFMDAEAIQEAEIQKERRKQGFHDKYEQKYCRKDGSLMWATLAASPLQNQEGRIIGFLGLITDITEQKKAEYALRLEHGKLQAILENMSVGVVLSDNNGNTLFMNKAGLEIHGFQSIEDMFKKLDTYTEDFELHYPNGRIMPFEEWPASRAYKGDFVHDYEAILYKKSNKTSKHISYNVAPIRDINGSIVNFVFNITDLSEADKISKVLKKREKQYSYLFNNKTIAIAHCKMIFDDEGKPLDFIYLKINEAFSKITKIEKDKIENKRFTDVFPEIRNSKNDYIDRYGKLVKDKGEYNFETYFDILNQWFSVNVYSTYDSEFTLLFTDISERKLTEEKLLQKENELKEAQRIARLGSWSWNIKPETSGDHYEPMCIYGFDSESHSTPAFQGYGGLFYTAESWKKVNKAAQKALNDGTTYEIDVEAILNGIPIWVTMRGEIVRDAEGEIMGLKGTLQDITERKKTEKTLAQEREQFESIINNIPVMITFYDTERKSFKFNNEFKKITGWNEKDTEDGNLVEKIYPDPEYRKCVLEYMQSLKQGWAEFTMISKYGTSIESAWANIELSNGVRIGIGIDIHERKEAEAKIKESEQRLRELADNISPLTWVADANGSISWFSKRWYDYTEATPEESLYWGWMKFHHPDHVEEVLETYKNAIYNGKQWEKIVYLKGSDNQYRWFMSRAIPIRDVNNNIIRWFGSNSDIDNQINTEETLRRNEQRLSAMFSNVGVGIVEVDRNDRFVAVNDRICQILGYNREELLGKSVSEITYIEDLTKSNSFNEKLHKGELDSFAYEKRYSKKDGSPIWVQVTVSAIKDSHGNHINSIGTIDDISERKKVEEALLESEKRFRMLADNISQMVWVSNEKGVPIWFNKRWYDYTGTSLEEMQHGNQSVVHHPDYGEKVLQSFHESVRKGKPWEYTFPLKSKEGEFRWFLSRVLPIPDENGNISLWFGTNTDINEQMQIEEKLRRNQQRLQGVFDNAAIGIVEVDHNDRFIAVNNRICTILGYSREELLQKTVQEITAVEDRQHSYEMNKKLYHGEVDVLDYEKRYVKRDGCRLWVHVSVSSVRDKEGKHLQSIRTIEDITERKHAEETIKKSETILKQAGSMASLGAWEIEYFDIENPSNSVSIWSDQVYLIFGYEPGSVDISYDFFQNHVHPDDRMLIVDGVLKSYNENTTIYIEHRIIRKDGVERTVVENAEIIYNQENEKSIRIIGAIQDITERKQAEEKLHKALAQAEEGRNILTALMEYIPMGITIAEAPDAKVKMVSKYGQQLLDREFLKETPQPGINYEWGLFHPENFVKASPDEIPLTRSVKTGEIIKNEEWFLSNNQNKPIPILCNAAPILDKEEKIVGGIIAWQDITDRRKILEDLRQSEERLRVVIEASQLGTWDFDINTGVAIHSLRHDQIFGYNELQPEWSHEISIQHMLPEYHSIVREAVAKAIETGYLYYEAKIRWPDGSIHWIAPTGKVYYNSEGKPLRMVGILADITDRKFIEDAIKESEEKFRSLFENITEGVALHELVYENGNPVNYKILNVNPAYKLYHNITTKEVPVGVLVTDLFGKHDLKYIKTFSEVAETRIPQRFQAHFHEVNKHFIINVISPKVGQFATVFEDITEQKRIEQEMKQRNEELTRFIYTVSHDLKSPLVTIKSFTSYLKEDIESQDKTSQEKDIAYISNAADKMGKLLDELLELSRVGRKEHPKTEVMLQTVAQSAIDLVAGRISEKKVDVQITAPPVMLYGHGQRLIQLYQNLIDNAVKFTGKQTEPKVEIGAYIDENRNNEIVMFVRDNGLGIDPRYHHKLFGLFEKLDNNSEGTGIGLALIKRIIEVHEGSIWFESEGIDKGTTFYFTLKGAHLI